MIWSMAPTKPGGRSYIIWISSISPTKIYHLAIWHPSKGAVTIGLFNLQLIGLSTRPTPLLYIYNFYFFPLVFPFFAHFVCCLLEKLFGCHWLLIERALLPNVAFALLLIFSASAAGRVPIWILGTLRYIYWPRNQINKFCA